MNLSEYVLIILKNAYYQNAVTLNTPNYKFRFRKCIRLVRTLDASINTHQEPIYDSDDNIDFDHIIPKRKIQIDDTLYTPHIKKISGMQMGGKFNEWSIETEDERGIRVKHLLEIMARLKPESLVFKSSPLFYIRKVNVNVRGSVLEVCLYY